MTLEELKKCVAGGEGDRVEFKETTGQRTEACRTLCAFLNGDGGTVVFGVTKKGKLTGQLVSDETKRNLATAFCDIEPGLEIPVEYVPVDDTHQAIVCRVGGGPRKPYVYDGRPYRRLQSSTMKMPQDQYVAMIAARGGYQSKWELEWNENVTLDDIDSDEVKRTAHIAVSEGRLSPDVDMNDPKDLLRRFGLLKGERPLNGAMAVFGKNIGLIINACEKAHLAQPRIYEDRGFIYTVFTRPTKQEWNAKVKGGNQGATENEGTGLKTGLKTRLKDNPETVAQTLRQMIKDNPAITIPMMSEATKLSRNGVLYHLQTLKEKFGLTRVGGRKGGHWEFLK